MTLARIQQCLIAYGLIGHRSMTGARAKADKGIESARRHAEDDRPGWGDTAQTVLRWFLRRHDQPFTIEEARLWSEAHDLPQPPELRAWGSVTQRALREGLIVKTGGYRATASSNGSVRALYRKA